MAPDDMIADPVIDPNVRAAFDAFMPPIRAALMDIRALIFAVAGRTDGVGPITETLKWGQPAYLTAATKSGTTIRLGTPKSGGFAIFTHWQTKVIPEFQALFADDFTYDGTRAVVFTVGDRVNRAALELLIHRALTCHL